MRTFLLLALIAGCSHELPVQRPSWVDNVRSGEETLKVVNGNKTYYRRIAGSPALTRQASCNLVIMKAEEDLKKDRPSLATVPYTVEVLYYDVENQDCAVTISVSRNVPEESLKVTDQEKLNRKIALDSKEFVSEDEAGEIVQLRSELAMKYALTGLTKPEFEKFAKDKVTILSEENMCSGVFRTNTYSIHGTTHVCWKGEIIAGYCMVRDRQCWTRTP